MKKNRKNRLLETLRDKGRTMKIESLLSNNYVLAGMLAGLDLLILMLMSYLMHLIKNAPAILLGKSGNEMFSIIHMFDFRKFQTEHLLFLLAGIIVTDMILAVKIKIAWSEDHFNVGQKGVARFVNDDEIRQEYKAIEPLEKEYPGNPGILVSRIGNTFYIDDMVVNNLILGITRSGKGEIFVKSSIEIYSRAQFQPSLIINDPKLEHYKVFKPLLEERGYDVFLLNVSNPKLSMGFNLLTVAVNFYKKKDYDMSEQVVNSLTHSFFDVDNAKGEMLYFVQSAAALCAAMILAAIEDAFEADRLENEKRYRLWSRLPEEEKKEHPFCWRNDNEKTIHFHSILVTFGEMVERPVNKTGTRTMLDIYFEQRPPDNHAKMKYLAVKVAPGRTKSGVFSEMLSELDIFTLQNVGMMTAESSLDMEQIGFGKRPVAVFMSTPSYDSSLYKIPTIFIRQMYYVLGKKCDDEKGRCDRQVKVILDEKGNMPKIDLMNVMTTMGLGQNISFDFYLHNYDQLDDTYGTETAKTIRGNCGNHFFIQTNVVDTAKRFSEMLGNKSMIDVQRAGSKLTLNKYITESVQPRPLLNENELMELQEGEIVIVRRSKRRDLQNKKITPRPIFNSLENGRFLWYSYEFFPKEKYPHPNDVNFLDICEESREHIRLKERIWDIEKSFRLYKSGSGTESQRRTKFLGDYEKYEELEKMLRKVLGNHMEEKYGIGREATVAELVSLLNSGMFSENDRDVLLKGIEAMEGGNK